MKIVYGDLFQVMKNGYDAVGIPTNGHTNNSGLATMGAGVARAAVQTFGMWIREFLGAKIDRHGNNVHVLQALNADGDPIKSPPFIFSFPTKHHWSDKRSDMALIEKSADQLKAVIAANKWKSVCMPEPGTGMGGLQWDDVSKILEKRFGDELTIVRLLGT